MVVSRVEYIHRTLNEAQIMLSQHLFRGIVLFALHTNPNTSKNLFP
jgi:hypothetical protein